MMRVLVTLAFMALAGSSARAAPKPSSMPRARLLSAPKPVYPEAAIKRHIQGSGQFRIDVDPGTGKPLRVVVVRSTGSPLLDAAAVVALGKWRAAPGTIRVINLPLVYRLTARGPVVGFR